MNFVKLRRSNGRRESVLKKIEINFKMSCITRCGNGPDNVSMTIAGNELVANSILPVERVGV